MLTTIFYGVFDLKRYEYVSSKSNFFFNLSNIHKEAVL